MVAGYGDLDLRGRHERPSLGPLAATPPAGL
jgi:hypothetical protein